ncbi:MAG: glycosyltransferase family 2 protein [Bacteroidales bacterium]|nr:glycosyltransferase family 2 protein [Bacteroidales bacterium]
MTIQPISVLMPVYNAGIYLKDAIESILNQTFREFEFIIIDDGSTDGSLDIIKSYTDKRIRLIENGENIRLIATLNKGIELSEGKYIARMDADDISLPDRLQKQFAFMEAHPEIGLCGSYIRTIGLEHNYDVHFKTTHDEIKFKLFFDTHFPHPAAMIRKSVLIDNMLRFKKEFIHAEDFALWNEMAALTQLAVIPEILVHKRTHSEQISKKFTPTQLQISSEIRKMLINKLDIKPDDEEISLYDKFLENDYPRKKNELLILLNFIDKLIYSNTKKDIYKKELFNVFFAQKYWDICTKSTHLGFFVFKLFNSSEAKTVLKISFLLKLKFFVKSLLKYNYDRK